MSNIEIMHTTKGFQRSSHKYISRKMVNGKWVYQYAKDAVNSAPSKATNVLRKASNAANAAADYIDPNGTQVAARRQAKVAQKNAKALSRKLTKQSAERAARLRKIQQEKRIAAGKAKVDEIVSRTKNSATSTVNNAKSHYKRQYEGAKAGAKSAKQSRERAARLRKIQTERKINNAKSTVVKTATNAAQKAYEAPQNLNKKINKKVASSKYNPDVIKTRTKKKVRKTQRKINAAQKAYKNTR